MINFILIEVIAISLLVYISFLIVSNIRRHANKSNGDVSILLRILTNYFQVITITSYFNLNWPIEMQKFYNIFSQVGQVSNNIVSLDCLIKDNVIRN